MSCLLEVLLLLAHLCAFVESIYLSGCVVYHRKGLFRHEDVAPCKGSWKGHVDKGNILCSSGWDVCSWKDVSKLRKLTWDDAMSVRGCYAYNADQSRGNCMECSRNSITTSLAGIGRSCRYRKRGRSACINGGIFDVNLGSYSPDSCSYNPSRISGVLCCRSRARKPKFTLSPPKNMVARSRRVMILPCRATGLPPPVIHWFKNGLLLRNKNHRLSVLSSGDLLLVRTHSRDSGVYTCQALNDFGSIRAYSTLRIQNRLSGCRDRTTDALTNHRKVHACSGVWRGHVKRARKLCARGWDVCNPLDEDTLTELGWNEVSQVPGCYAYNAANTWGRCSICHSRKMAGIGKNCGKLRLHKTSCLPQGRIDVFLPKIKTSCLYKTNVTTGVLCCRKKYRQNKKKPNPQIICKPRCRNGGTCVGKGRCLCRRGYRGSTCQIERCRPPCARGYTCVWPNYCQCIKPVHCYQISPPKRCGKKCRKSIGMIGRVFTETKRKGR